MASDRTISVTFSGNARDLASASAEATKALEGVRGKMDELGRKVARPSVKLDGSDKAGEDMAALLMRLDLLGRKIANPRITVDGSAKAVLEIAAVNRELDRLNKQKADASGGIKGLLSNIPVVGQSLASNGTLAGPGLSGMGAIAAAGPALIPVAASLTAVLGGLAAAAAPAMAGIGALGLVAQGTLSSVSQGATAWETYNRTLAAGGLSKAQAATAFRTLQRALVDMSPAQQAASKQLYNFQQAWQGFRSSFDPLILGIFTQGLTILQAHMGALRPLINAAGGAISQLLTMLGKGLNSKGFQDFVAWLSAAAGPAIVAFGRSIGNLAVGFAGILRAFQPMAVIVEGGLIRMTGAFAKWGAGLAQSHGFQQFIDYAKTNGPALISTLENVGKVVWRVIVALAPLGAALLRIVSILASAIAWVTHFRAVQMALIPGIVALAVAFGGPVVAVSALIAGLTALVTAIIKTWQGSEMFRAVVIGVFRAVADAVLGAVAGMLHALSLLLLGASTIPGPWDGAFRRASASVDAASGHVSALKANIDAVSNAAIFAGGSFNAMASMAANAANAAASAISRVSAASAAGIGGSVLSRRAGGGPVSAYTPYIVGEAGPEVFVPAQAGVIVPNGATSTSRTAAGGSGGGDVYVTVQGHVLTPDGLASSIAPAVRAALIRYGQRNGGRVGLA